MPKKEGRIVATGVNPQGVPWKEISFIEERNEEKIKEAQKKKVQMAEKIG